MRDGSLSDALAGTRDPDGIAREKNMIVVTTTKKWFRRLADRKVSSRGHARILSERGQTVRRPDKCSYPESERGPRKETARLT